MIKGIYLDIDMDFFVEPIEKVSVDNIRLYHDKACTSFSVAPIVDKLKQKGINWSSQKISCFTNHKTSYTHWWIMKKQDNVLIHIDAHSDLYRNCQKDLRFLKNSEIGCYNYIWYAIRDGYVGEVYWVIPEGLKHLLAIDKAHSIINKGLIRDTMLDEKGLHIMMECILATGATKEIPLHVCTVDMLPDFNRECEKVTIATSPEFVPAACDELVFELMREFGASSYMAENIYRQHKNMLNKTPEELQEAFEKIKEIGA